MVVIGQYIWGILEATVQLFNEMAFYLLLGFFFAGVIHIIFPSGLIYKHLGKANVCSIVKASLIGIPLPLCSCGVLPMAISLRKQGASKASVLSFLISTPTSGVDSIMATYSLLGLVFTIFRIVGSFITAFVAGIATLLFIPKEEIDEEPVCVDNSCAVCGSEEPHHHTLWEKISGIIKYGFWDLLEDSGKWVFIGVIVGGIITFLIPASLFERYLDNQFLSMLVMLFIGIPIYVCATGSIPIVAALLMKGLSPGAGFVFLLTGPATNATSLTILVKYLGKKTVLLYLIILILCGILLGYALNITWDFAGLPHISHIMSHGKLIPEIVKIFASIILAALIVSTYISTKIKRIKSRELVLTDTENTIRIKVPDMTCQHCVHAITKGLNQIENIKGLDINLETKIVEIEYEGEDPREEALKIITGLGYNPQK
ncbi:SO_0444 family Cu/Zn efflux transporter [bacterium]|nr:SO_0444 family Cu/Zn efflux transporter [bacterium]